MSQNEPVPRRRRYKGEENQNIQVQSPVVMDRVQPSPQEQRVQHTRPVQSVPHTNHQVPPAKPQKKKKSKLSAVLTVLVCLLLIVVIALLSAMAIFVSNGWTDGFSGLIAGITSTPTPVPQPSPTPIPTPTATPIIEYVYLTPEPTAAPTPTPTPTPTPSPVIEYVYLTPSPTPLAPLKDSDMIGTWVDYNDNLIVILTLKQNHSVDYMMILPDSPITVNNKYPVLTATRTDGIWSLSGNRLSVKTYEMTIPMQLAPDTYIPITMETQTIVYVVNGDTMMPTENKMFKDHDVTSFSKL